MAAPEDNALIDQLSLEATSAKHGASDVVARLRHLMDEGAPSITDLAYTIRLREKEHYRIVEKVLRKRRETDPTYAVSRIRDIVGLRIVTLYRLDALEIIPRLIEFLKRESSSSTALFLSDRLEEIKIYSTNPKGDAQALPQRLVGLFDYFGYGDRAKIEDTPSNYTSIHLVTWCRGRYRGNPNGYANVPVEIQIRTALEDAWGEIDHKLKYKPPGRTLSLRDEMVLKGCLTHLNVMKSFVDGAAQYADQIKVQADYVTARRFLSTSHRLVDDTSTIVRGMNLPSHVMAQIEDALFQQTEAMHATRRGREYAEARVGNLRNAIRELEASLELVREHVSDESKNKRLLLDYYIPLEIALCQFQLATELENDKELLAEVVRRYEAVQPKYANRAVIPYRLGRALAALGDYPAAIKKLEEANDLLKANRDPSVDKDHWIRLSVPRNLGVYLWELAEQIRGREPNSDDAKKKMLATYLEAYRVTRAAYAMRVEPDGLCDKFDTETKYRGKLANNLLYYLADYRDAGGDRTELEKLGHKEEEVDIYLKLLEDNFAIIDTPSTLHTMLRYYVALAREDMRVKTARKLYRVLRELGVADTGGKSHEEEMLRLAATSLGNQNLS